MTAAVALAEELPVIDESGAKEKPARYEFDCAFQSKIAALSLRDTAFLQKTEGLVRPEYFEDASEQALVAVAIAYFAKYRKAPGDISTIAALLMDAKEKKILRHELLALVKDRVKRLYVTDISDRDYVADKCAEFARHQAVARAILDSVTKLDKKDFEGISAAVKKALDVGVHIDTGAYDYFGMLDARTEIRLERAAGKLPPTGISTGYPAIDCHLYHKGWGFKELSVLMGRAKMGKTTALIDFGINAIATAQRYNCLYATLEVGKEIIADRIDANVSEQVIMELGEHIHDVKGSVRAFMERAGKFVIHEFPSGAMTVTDLRRLLERYKSRGMRFDLVIVDYADLMAPERWTENAQENSKSVYVGLRGLAMQEEISILTATQTNREGAKKAVATMTDVAEDFNKIRIADVVISINKTDEEHAANQARLYFAACRNQASGFTIRIVQDLERMQFIKSVTGVE